MSEARQRKDELVTEIPNARVGDGEVLIGGVKLPGLICDGGVRIKPGLGQGLNIVTVDFIVGEVVVEDGE